MSEHFGGAKDIPQLLNNKLLLSVNYFVRPAKLIVAKQFTEFRSLYCQGGSGKNQR